MTALQAKGCGIAIGAASRQGSEGSEGSARFQQAGLKGVVSPMEPLRGRVHRVQKVQRVQRVVDCPAGNAYKVSVTGLPFCHISRSKHGGELATSGGFSPFGALRHHLPPAEAVGLWALRNKPHDATGNRKVKFPHRGKGGASAPKGVHFPRAQSAVCLFSLARKGGCTVLSYWRPFIFKGAHHPL